MNFTKGIKAKVLIKDWKIPEGTIVNASINLTGFQSDLLISEMNPEGIVLCDPSDLEKIDE